eukprot:TRINITY_DN12769_c0_g2_i1.p1 TRINITY_DN12769_c0_g2~~TRINITY_DN12769_c0_g2_i1.p1  ORF type:complete len:172 (+),score=48.62 TRINITY_DN12769_c0_g2_i1:162-677(+)
MIKKFIRGKLRDCYSGSNFWVKQTIVEAVNHLLTIFSQGSLHNMFLEDFGRFSEDLLETFQRSWRPRLGEIFVIAFENCGIDLLDSTKQSWRQEFSAQTRLHTSEISHFSTILERMPFVDEYWVDELSVFADNFLTEGSFPQSVRLRKMAIEVLLRALEKFHSNVRMQKPD